MKYISVICSTIILGVVSLPGVTLAEKCSGTSARVYAKPVVAHKGKDGSQTLHLQSMGTSIAVVGPEASLTGAWQFCTGMLKTAADKSYSGSGHCYTVDKGGEYQSSAWKIDANGSTWESLGGSGKYANMKSKGTFKSGNRFANGLRTGTWEGECSK